MHTEFLVKQMLFTIQSKNKYFINNFKYKKKLKKMNFKHLNYDIDFYIRLS